MSRTAACIAILLQSYIFTGTVYSSTPVPANDPYIQYYGRWDFSNPGAPTHSWPGVYIYAKFQGTSIGISVNDNFCYYNVFIDDTLFSIFHGNQSGVASYPLASGLKDTVHTILFTLRNETNWTKFSFNGFILDDGKSLLPPPDRPAKKIEFIGDSYTCASGNLWIDNTAAPAGDYTDVYQGFAPITARHYGAQYMVSGRGGFGLVLDYQGIYGNSLPAVYDRALVYTLNPKWDFSMWAANLVVIALGLNDYNGWGGYSGPIAQDLADLYRERYHGFISSVMDCYPHTNILVVAPNDITWLKQQFAQVVAEENAIGHTNVFYADYPLYNGHYVNSYHPDVYAHNEISKRLIAVIDTIDAWTPFTDTSAPRFVSLPDTPLVATSSSFALTVKTSKYAAVRYSTQDKPYDQMENDFTSTGTRDHSVLLSCAQSSGYTYYVRAKDSYGNETVSSALIHFTVDTTKELAPWNSPLFNHSLWKKGSGPLGNDASGLYNTALDTTRTAYVRQIIPFQNISGISQLNINVYGKDGVVAYLNGYEVGRVNMEQGADISYTTTAIKPMKATTTLNLTARTTLKYLREGDNIFAFEVHPWSISKKGVVFDAQITDDNNTVYYDNNSEWYYYDNGRTPPSQVIDKQTTDVSALNANAVPDKIVLYANYPNPFNPSTTISFDLSKKSFVQLKIYNLLGQLVGTLANGTLDFGKHLYRFNAHDLSSGAYFYRLTVRGEDGTSIYAETKSMMLMK